MYRIYFKKAVFILTATPMKTAKNVTVVNYFHDTSVFVHLLERAEADDISQKFIIVNDDVEQLKTDFWSAFKLVEAAGGTVFNTLGEVLFIFRRGFWDLPKGKIDPGETKAEAAVREVLEETGLEEVTQYELIHTSYHIYRNRKNKPCLKPTYWYRMTTEKTAVALEYEEGIESSEWIKPADFLADNRVTYPAILDVMKVLV